jgi:ribose transport system ATP-binding protein
VLTRFGLEVDPSQRVAELSPASQTMIEIARALQDQEDQDEGLVALDEPTATLAPREVERLLQILRNLAAMGQSILFVSHRVDEVLTVADRITVLRDGKYIDTVSPEGLTRERLTELITGRQMASYRHEAASTSGTRADALEVEGLCGGAIREANLSVAHGEIVGVAGLAGSGRSTLLRLLFGLEQRDGGVVRLDGKPLAPRAPGQAIRAHVAYLSENRVQDAILPGLSVAENMSILDLRKYWRGGWIRRNLERADVDEAMGRFHIKAASASAAITSLSGGNQQKVALARWLRLEPRLLLLDEPTQGVDVGARAELWELIRKVADAGTPVIVVSSDFEELTQLCSRLVVLRGGVTVANISAADLDPDEINHLLHEMQVAA